MKTNFKIAINNNNQKDINDLNMESLIEENVYKNENHQYDLNLNTIIDDNINNKIDEDTHVNISFNNLVKNKVTKRLSLIEEENPFSYSESNMSNRFKEIAQNYDAHINKSNDNKKSSGNKRFNNSWIARLIDQRGKDYIFNGGLSVEEVNRNMNRIIDDIISGRIDYGKFGQYIIHSTIIDTMISYCSNKLAINNAIYYSLGYTYNYLSDSNTIENNIPKNMIHNITQATIITSQDLQLYNTLYTRLVNVRDSGNIAFLYNISSELNLLKRQMKKRY